MDVSWDLYKYFYFVCEFKNLTKVANYFCVTQPAITKKIKQLEDQLGERLVISSNKGIKITEKGMELYKKIEPAVEAFSNAEEMFDISSKKATKVIKVSSGYVTADKVLMPTAFRFKHTHPEISFNIETYSIDEMFAKLKSGDTDVIFYGGKRFGDIDNIVEKECYTIKNSIVISSKIKNDFPSEISIYDLNKYPLIVKGKKSGTRKILDEFLGEKNITLEPKYEVANYWSIVYYIKSNMGMGFLNKDFIKDEIESGELVEIPVKEDIPEITVCCAYLKSNKNKAIIKEYIDAVKEKMGPAHYNF